MTPVSHTKNRRILVIDDNESIHADFRKILCRAGATEALAEDEAAAPGPETASERPVPVSVTESATASAGPDASRTEERSHEARTDG